MKNLVVLVSFLFVYSFGYSQILSDVDYVAPFHDGLAAVKKSNQWAFINEDGEKVIDFRNDIVMTSNKDYSDAYPLFNDDRCLIRRLVKGVYYYGYINSLGEEIIKPQYLNATKFKNGHAIIIKFAKNVMGNNGVLGKQVVTYKLEEYVIDISGSLIKYLDNARNSLPSKIKNNTPPSFYSKFITARLIAVKTKNNKWNIYKF